MKTAKLEFRGFALALLACFVPSAIAIPITYEIAGTITQYGANNLPDIAGAVSVGDLFTGTLTYDPSGLGDPSYEITVGTAGRFTSSVGRTGLNVTDNGLHGDSLTFISSGWGSDLNVALGFFRSDLTLLDRSGTALSSSAIPAGINLADWPDQHSIFFIADLVVNPPDRPIQTFTMTADITSIRSVPESGATGILLALALAGLIMVHKFFALAKA